MSQYLEGRRALNEALDLQLPITCVYTLDKDEKKQDAVLKRLKHAGIPIKFVRKDMLDRYSSHGAHQGFIAELPPYKYASLSHILQGSMHKKHSLIVVADHITDEGNLGALLRSAEIVGADGVILPQKRSAQISAGVYKTSAGAALHIPIAQVANITQALENLKQQGYWVVGASEKAPEHLWDTKMDGRIVLVMGSEGEGISRLVLEHCDMLISIPQAGKISSLNVAQAATVCMFEWMRQSRI